MTVAAERFPALKPDIVVPVVSFDPVTRAWTPVGKEFDLALQRGGGALLRLHP